MTVWYEPDLKKAMTRGAPQGKTSSREESSPAERDSGWPQGAQNPVSWIGKGLYPGVRFPVLRRRYSLERDAKKGHPKRVVPRVLRPVPSGGRAFLYVCNLFVKES